LEDAEQAEFTKVDKRVRTAGGGATGSVRNLRIREDTAKYLLNLDPNSAHYDPKSRSMRADPQPDKAPHEKTFAGDNATRSTGDYEYWRQLTEHSVLEGEKGSSMHVQAAPTQALLAHQAFKEKKAKLAQRTRLDVLDKYGNAAAGQPDADLLLPASEAYVEYDRSCASPQVPRGSVPLKTARFSPRALSPAANSGSPSTYLALVCS
jgi:pre-mRNA-processing factor SLU7